MPINTTWFNAGSSSNFVATPHIPSNPSAMDVTQSSSSIGSNMAQKSMKVSFTLAWLWSAPIAQVSHLTLANIYHASISSTIAASSQAIPTLLNIFEDDEIFPSPLSLSVQKHLHPTPMPKRSKDTSYSTTTSLDEAWNACSDIWLQWIILRLLLILEPGCDFEHFHSSALHANLGGNRDGVGECVWKLCERLSSFVTAPSPRYIRPIRSIALETINKFAELCIEGSQRFWNYERLKLLFASSNHFADLTQGFLVSDTGDVGSTIPPSLICHYSSESVLQCLLLCAFIFCKSPIISRSNGGPQLGTTFNTTPSVSLLNIGLQEGQLAEGDHSESSMKRPEFLSWVARYTGSPLPNMTSAPQMTQDRKKALASQLKAQLVLDFSGSPSKVLQLCRALLVELVLPDSVNTGASVSMTVPGISGTPLRVVVGLLDLLKKSPFIAFPHLPHFSHLVQISPTKMLRTFIPQPTMEVDFGFLSRSDYRKLIAERPFMAYIDFVALNDFQKLESYFTDSILRLTTPGATNNDEKNLVTILGWAYARISLERTLQICAYAIIQTSSTASGSSLSRAIDLQHQQLLGNPRLLFGFDLRLLERSTFFNYIFYTLISYYWCLAKVDIAGVMESTGNSFEASSTHDFDNDSEDDENDSKEDDQGEESSNIRSSGSTTKSVGVDSSDGSSAEPSSPRGSALTDPFHLRAVKSAKSAANPHGLQSSRRVSFLSGEHKLSTNDAELLKRLEDCVLVHLLVDLLLLVEDLPENGGVELGGKNELRGGICGFLQQLFVNDAALMNMVHQQGYPSRALPWLVEQVPAMHFCLELAPPMLAQSFQRYASSDSPPSSVAFSIQMAAWVVKRYPTPRSLEIATYIFDLFRSVGKSLHPNLWRSTLPDLARMVLTFPSLAPSLVDLVQLHSPSHVSPTSNTMLSSHSSSNPKASSKIDYHLSQLSAGDDSSMQSGASSSSSNVEFSKSVLTEVFSILTKGQSTAPYLKE